MYVDTPATASFTGSLLAAAGNRDGFGGAASSDPFDPAIKANFKIHGLLTSFIRYCKTLVSYTLFSFK